jgi:hypothetical protein
MRIMLLFIVLLLSGPVVAQEKGNIIVAELSGGRVVYEVDGKRRNLVGLLGLFRERVRQTGILPKDDIAIILASKNLSILQIQNLCSALQAFGFSEIHLFGFASEKTILQKLELDPRVIPFTTARAPLMKAIGK